MSLAGRPETLWRHWAYQGLVLCRSECESDNVAVAWWLVRAMVALRIRFYCYRRSGVGFFCGVWEEDEDVRAAPTARHARYQRSLVDRELETRHRRDWVSLVLPWQQRVTLPCAIMYYLLHEAAARHAYETVDETREMPECLYVHGIGASQAWRAGVQSCRSVDTLSEEQVYDRWTREVLGWKRESAALDQQRRRQRRHRVLQWWHQLDSSSDPKDMEAQDNDQEEEDDEQEEETVESFSSMSTTCSSDPGTGSSDRETTPFGSRDWRVQLQGRNGIQRRHEYYHPHTLSLFLMQQCLEAEPVRPRRLFLECYAALMDHAMADQIREEHQTFFQDFYEALTEHVLGFGGSGSESLTGQLMHYELPVLQRTVLYTTFDTQPRTGALSRAVQRHLSAVPVLYVRTVDVEQPSIEMRAHCRLLRVHNPDRRHWTLVALSTVDVTPVDVLWSVYVWRRRWGALPERDLCVTLDVDRRAVLVFQSAAVYRHISTLVWPALLRRHATLVHRDPMTPHCSVVRQVQPQAPLLARRFLSDTSSVSEQGLCGQSLASLFMRISPMKQQKEDTEEEEDSSLDNDNDDDDDDDEDDALVLGLKTTDRVIAKTDTDSSDWDMDRSMDWDVDNEGPPRKRVRSVDWQLPRRCLTSGRLDRRSSVGRPVALFGAQPRVSPLPGAEDQEQWRWVRRVLRAVADAFQYASLSTEERELLLHYRRDVMRWPRIYDNEYGDESLYRTLNLVFSAHLYGWSVRWCLLLHVVRDLQALDDMDSETQHVLQFLDRSSRELTERFDLSSCSVDERARVPLPVVPDARVPMHWRVMWTVLRVLPNRSLACEFVLSLKATGLSARTFHRRVAGPTRPLSTCQDHAEALMADIEGRLAEPCHYEEKEEEKGEPLFHTIRREHAPMREPDAEPAFKAYHVERGRFERHADVWPVHRYEVAPVRTGLMSGLLHSAYEMALLHPLHTVHIV